MAVMKSKNVALVLSSGGARGITQIGIIRELEARGYNITSISGASIGALVGGLYATNSMDEYADWVRKMNRMDVISHMDFVLGNKGFIKGIKVFKHMDSWLDGRKIEDLKIDYTAVATDLLNHEEVVFDKGPLKDAIRASISVPYFVAPLEKDHRLLFDGGIINPIPLNRVKRNPGDILIAVNLCAHIKDPKPLEPVLELEPVNNDKWHFETLKKKLWPSFISGQEHTKQDHETKVKYFEIINKTADVMMESLCQYALEAYPPEVTINIPHELCSTFEFNKSELLIEYGRESARQALDIYESK
ncbi:MAG: patatin-like phospholipase family protein [Bacteroidales bacterium]|nr:patatin-like phospholipase family protein [Bacteroidales bacterium]